jgi:hypothetical protein
MKLFAKLFNRPPPIRRKLDGATVTVLLGEAIKGRTAVNYRHVGFKATMSVVTMQDIERAADKVFPWRKDVWECEDQARHLVNNAQRTAANEGCSWAIGILRGLPVPRSPKLAEGIPHIWLWCLVEDDAGRLFPASQVHFFDATARRWAKIEEITDIDFSMT